MDFGNWSLKLRQEQEVRVLRLVDGRLVRASCWVQTLIMKIKDRISCRSFLLLPPTFFSGPNAQRRYYSHSGKSLSVANPMSGGSSASASHCDSSNASLVHRYCLISVTVHLIASQLPCDVSPSLSRSPSVVPTVTDKVSFLPPFQRSMLIYSSSRFLQSMLHGVPTSLLRSLKRTTTCIIWTHNLAGSRTVAGGYFRVERCPIQVVSRSCMPAR